MNMVDEIYKAGVESLPVGYTVYPGSFEDVLPVAAAVMAVRAAGTASTAAEQATLDAHDLHAIRSAYLDSAGTNGTMPELVGAVRRGGAAPLALREPEVRLTREDIKPERLRAVAVDAQACTGLVDTATNDAVFGFILPTGPLAIRLDLAGVKFVRNLLNRLPIARDESEDAEAGALVEEGLREKVAELEWALEASRLEVARLNTALLGDTTTAHEEVRQAVLWCISHAGRGLAAELANDAAKRMEVISRGKGRADVIRLAIAAALHAGVQTAVDWSDAEAARMRAALEPERAAMAANIHELRKLCPQHETASPATVVRAASARLGELAVDVQEAATEAAEAEEALRIIGRPLDSRFTPVAWANQYREIGEKLQAALRETT